MPNDADRASTPAGVFGAELRYYRTRAGLSQKDLAARAIVSHDVISKIETGDRPPTEDFPARLDAVAELDTGGALDRLWGHLKKSLRQSAYGWFQRWADIEAQATTLRTYQPLVMPGLLQTEDYARAVLSLRPGAGGDDVDVQAAARLARQGVLDRAQFWCVLDEGVLHRQIGEAKVMQAQLDRLAGLAGHPKVTIQVIPGSFGHAGLLGAFTIADIDGKPPMVYLETAAEGQVTDSPAVAGHVALRFDKIRSEALPWGRIPRPDQESGRRAMDMTSARWRTSSYSGDNGGDCIEVGTAAESVAVRDSKDPGGPQLAFTAAAWTAFTSQLKANG